MKKSILMLAVISLIALMAGCITIQVNPGETKETETPLTEAPTTKESSETEQETETTQVPDMFDPASYFGVWAAEGETAPYFLFREDESCRYAEIRSNDVSLVEGKAGLAELTRRDGVMGYSISFIGLDEFDEGFLRRSQSEGDTLVLTGKNSEMRFHLTDLTEDDLFELAMKQMDRLHGIINELDDGLYASGQDKPEDPHYGAYFTEAYIDEGILYIHGFLSYFDAEWKEHYVNEEIADFKFDLADDVVISSTGGDPTHSEEKDASYFNECFVNNFTGLGISITIEGNLIKKIDVGS